MKLYSGDLSPYSAKVRMQIYAKGIADIPLERPAAFPTLVWRETSPLGRIPVLELSPGDVIPESEVIAEYLEEVYPTPRLLGATPRESAAIRTLSRLADIYLLNNMFMLAGQTRRSTRSEAVRDLLAGQVVRGVEALEKMIDGEGGYALLGPPDAGRLYPGPGAVHDRERPAGHRHPRPDRRGPKVATYWAAIQRDPSAAKVMVELHRGLAERRELIRRAAEKEAAGG